MTNTPDSVMLFAAGFGTRMGALTKNCPKPLIEVGGTALIDHTLKLARELSPKHIVANAHYLSELLAAHLSETDVQLSYEAPDILETGGGLRAALPLLGEGPVFTGNTDAIWAGPNPFSLARQAWNPETMDALLVCISPDQAVGHAGGGDFRIDTDGRLHRGPGVIYGGIQIIKTDGLKNITDRAFSLNQLWDQMLATDRLFGLTYPGRWCDVGSPQGIQLAETLLKGSYV